MSAIADTDRRLLAWVLARPEGATPRETVRAHARYRHPGGTADARADLDRLVARGLLVAEEYQPVSRGRPATAYYGR